MEEEQCESRRVELDTSELPANVNTKAAAGR